MSDRMPGPARPGAVRRFFGGTAYLRRGFGLWATSPRLMLLGTIPALVVGAVYLVAIVLFAANLDAITAAITPFADSWAGGGRLAVRLAAGVALVLAGTLLAVYTFTAVTLAVGDPFYERIWREVEERLGGAPPEVDESIWRSAARGLGTALRLFAVTAPIGVALFLCGFIPVVGQTVVPVLGAIAGGWFLTLELCGFAFDARRMTLRSRRRMLGGPGAGALGFGMLVYLLFLIPLGAVIVMPAAVAGATLLSRDALAGEGEGSSR